MWMTILTVLWNNKLLREALFAGVGIIALVSLYFMWVNKVKQEALLEYKNAQIEEQIKEQKVVNEKLAKVNADSQIVIKNLNATNEELTKRFAGVSVYLNSPKAKTDSRKSSDVLKNTIKDLIENTP